MIYVSSTCIKTKRIQDSILTLVNAGFKNIEISGGNLHNSEYEKDLLELQDKYEINFLMHNYFPFFSQSSVLNLASLNDKTYNESIKLCELAINFSKKLGGKKYGIHAGYYHDLQVKDLGNTITNIEKIDKKKSINRFIEAWKFLLEKAGLELELYLENNVISKKNFANFNNNVPFLFVDYKDYLELANLINFKPLLDIGHLKVSSKVLNNNFESEIKLLNNLTDYIHISDNDGFSDQNKGFAKNNNFFSYLKKEDLANKTLTLEIYNNTQELIHSHEILEKFING